MSLFSDAVLFLCCTVLVRGENDQCWWTGCQPSSWKVRGCSVNYTTAEQKSCPENSSSMIYKCCPKLPLTTTTPAPVLVDCWWTGCQPSDWEVKGCSKDRITADFMECEEEDFMKYKCCLEDKSAPVTTPTPIPSAINMTSCWWSGCQPKDWAVRGCPLKMVGIDSDICGNHTHPGDMYKCCNAISNSKDDETPTEGDSCWWTSCKVNVTNGKECPENAVSTDIEPCDGRNGVVGDQYQCCFKVPGAVEVDWDERNISYYKNYVRYLLLQSLDFEVIPDRLKCTDVDPEKSFVITLEGDEENGIRMCDLCPNFPVDKLTNVMINRSPLTSISNTDLSDCFGSCYTQDDCVALSFDHVDKICYLFNGTLGQFEQEDGWTTIFINQPTGILQRWMYSRHTRISGLPLKSLNTDSFFSCLANCDQTENCNHVYFNFMNNQCQLFDGKSGVIGVDLEYGSVIGYDLELTSSPGDVEWRFTEDDIDQDSSESVPPVKANVSSPCLKPKEEGLDNIYSPKCTAGGLGCDTSTGCLTCYYPEITLGYRQDLPICPESAVLSRQDVRNKLQSCFIDCEKSPTCTGIDFKEKDISCQFLTFNTYLKDANPDSRRYILQYPKPSDPNKANFLKFTLIPNHDITNPDSKTWFRSIEAYTWNECLKNCLQSNECTKVAYSSSKKSCKLASDSVSIKDNRLNQNEDYHLYLRQPVLNSNLFVYKRTPGWVGQNDQPKTVEKYQCGNQDCAKQVPKCVETCSKRYASWCEHISIEYLKNEISCTFYNWQNDVNLAPKQNAEVLTVKYSRKTINLEILNNLTIFQLQDLTGCFEKSDGQSQGTLVTNDEVFDFSNSETSVRRRRNIFKKIGNAFKKLGKAIVDTVKSVGKEIVDTVKNVGKTIGKVVTGDFKGAKDAFLDIPIVKSGKNAVENVIKLGKSVVKGDWKEAGNAALGFASNALDFVPGPGKLLKAGGQIVKNVIGKGAKTAQKDVGKKGKNQITKDVNKNRDTNKNKSDKKPENNNPDRCRRATANKRKRPVSSGSCSTNNNNDSNKKKNSGSCPVLRKNKNFPLLDALDCKNVKAKHNCGFECDVGYDENPITLKCSATGSGKPKYVPNPSCKIETCGRGVYPIINVRVPSPVKINGRRTRISAFVLQVDKTRRLPIWSMAYMDSMNHKKKPKQKRKSDFYDYPCLDRSQPKGNDFPSSKTTGFKTIHRGHLTPANVMLFSGKAAKASNIYINIAPQDGMTNSVYWQAIEAQVECFTNRIKSLVVTGICPKDIGKTKGGLDIPECYWKMVCYKKPEDGKTTVIGFLGDNSLVLPSDILGKESRKKQLSSIVSQAEIEKKMIGRPGYTNPWIQGGRFVFVGRNPGKDPLNPVECAAFKGLDQDEKKEWEENIKGGKKKTSGSRGKRAVPSKNTRGCTEAEAKNLALLLGLPSILMSGLEDNPPDDTDNDDQQGDGGNLVPAAKCNKRLIGYYPSWGTAKFSFKQAQRLTHIVYAFLEMKADGTISVGNPDHSSGENSDDVTATATARLTQLMDKAKQFSHLKVMFAVGGWENSQYFSSVAASPQKRITFIASVVQNIEKWGFDGVDIDWEYPVTGGAHEGVPEDKQNYVQLMKELRAALDQLANNNGRGGNDPYLLSFAGAAGQWTLDPGFDLKGLLKYANWVNVMTYDFFGAWASEWGAYTGPPAPLYFGMPKRYSGKTNVDWTMKYYVCRSNSPHQITMGVPFYGRFWRNVGPPIDPKIGMWRKAERVNGKFDGGYAGWKEIKAKYLPNGAFQQLYDDKVKAPYAWNEAEKIYLGYEDTRSLKVKAEYAVDKNLGGIMIWAIDQDDQELSMLNAVFDANLCAKTDPKGVNFKCSPITEKRWWTSEDGDDVAGLCGRSAPLFKGYYPVCDPDDPGYSCCGVFGYCGSGDEYCECKTCVDYANNPKKILDEPTKPTVPVQWYLLNAPDGKRGTCGSKAPKLNGKAPICNPDDPNAHCCSNGNFCGTGPEFCNCKGCVDFKKDPNHKFP